ncbi:MAG TPA: PEGA domain-containing protein, partial [Polyangia bacterium]
GKELTQRSPARLEGLEPGVPHLLSVHGAGQKGVAQRFTLGTGEEASMEIDLRRSQHAAVRRTTAHAVHAAAPAPASAVPAPPPLATPAPRHEGEGTLVIASSPWCTVTVDGQARGTTPLSLKLKAGAHEVVLANPDSKIKRSLAIDIEPNQTVRKSLDFAPE